MQPDSINLLFLRDEPTFPDEHFFPFIRYLDFLSSITTERFYVIDIEAEKICHVQSDNLFLCGYSSDDALNHGYDFYSKIVYPKDLSLWTDMRKAVLGYLKGSDENLDEVDYFSCTFRLQRKYFFPSPNLFQQMVYHRMKPVWENEGMRYLICCVGSSTAIESGNLRMYLKDRLTCKDYNTRTQKWKPTKIKPLTERERAILMLSQQGKSSADIAGDFHKGHNTIRNQKTALFSKLRVHSIQEAVEFAFDHRLMYPKQEAPKPKQQAFEVLRKRKRTLLTPDIFQRIQQALDNGLSIRHAARLEGIAPSAICYWIKHEKLKK